MAIVSLSGLVLGIGIYTFIYAKGYSYLTNDPAACSNCHVMEDQYGGWVKASHHGQAVCNDCHLPENLIGKYMIKGLNGFLHSFAFTTGWFHEPIAIRSYNLNIAERACRRCHGEYVIMADQKGGDGGRLGCIHCHKNSGHIR